jgi:hypothetical protein
MTKTDLDHWFRGSCDTKSGTKTRSGIRTRLENQICTLCTSATLVLAGSGFRHNFSKNCLERRPLRFSTICEKNQVLKLNIDKVTLILRLNSTSWWPYAVVSSHECVCVHTQNTSVQIQIHVYIQHRQILEYWYSTVYLIRTWLWILPLLLLGGIIENQNLDFVMQ